MRKREQVETNAIIENEFDLAYSQYAQAMREGEPTKRLRTCSAYVVETNDYYFLVSYNTMVAFISKKTDTLYDVLRLVFGYTATSSQHISKFSHDYGSGKYGTEHMLRWYRVD